MTPLAWWLLMTAASHILSLGVILLLLFEVGRLKQKVDTAEMHLNLHDMRIAQIEKRGWKVGPDGKPTF